MAVAAVALMLPSLLWGTLPTHSSLHNLTWGAQFAEQFRGLVLYPRWLASSFNGLGAPTFYFYPPLAFWVDALVSVLSFDVLSTSWRLSVTAVLLLWASGAALYAWLRVEAVARRVALLGALAYMAAPYHLVDHYIRGAMAEFAAYAPLPLVMCGVALVARRDRAGWLVLAASYAALVTAHLPTALLVSLTAIPAYVLFVAWRAWKADRSILLRCAAAFVLGLGLAAPYLVPALSLQDAVLIEWMWRYGFQVDQGFLLMPGRWVQPPYMIVIVDSIAAGWLLATLGLLIFWRRGPRQEGQPPILLWTAVSLAALLLMSGLVPWFWHAPMVSKVGFPWRLMIVVEFATLTALCLGAWPGRERLSRLLLLLAAVGFAPAVATTVNGIVGRIELAVKGDVPHEQDAREYLPNGFPQRPDASYAELDLEPTLGLPPIACTPAVRVCRAEAKRFGAMLLEIDSDQPTRVTLRRFAFPAWQLEPPLPLVATEPLRLVSFDAPPGRHAYRLSRRVLPAETWGWGLAAASLILLGLLTLRPNPDTRTACASP